MKNEASYICDGCGEEIVIPLDLSAGERQNRHYPKSPLQPVIRCVEFEEAESDEDTRRTVESG